MSCRASALPVPLWGGSVGDKQESDDPVGQKRQIGQALRASAARHAALLAAIPDIVMEVDAAKVYTWANEPGRRFFGDDVIGKEAAFYFEGEQKTYELVGPLFAGEERTIYVESWQRRRDGEKRLLAWWCRVLKDQAGNVTGALSSARDITEERRKERDLARLTQVLAAIRNVNQLIVHEHDRTRLVEQACAALVQTGAFSHSWLFLVDERRKIVDAASAGFDGADDPVDLYRAGQAPGCLAAFDHAGILDGARLQQICDRCPHTEACRSTARMLTRLWSDGHPRGVLGVSFADAQDITDEQRSLFAELAGDLDYAFRGIEEQARRQAAENALRASEAKFRDVFNHSPISKSLTLPSGEVNVNDAMAAMLGYSKEELSGLRWQDVTHPEDVEATQRALDLLLSRQQTSARLAKRYLHKNGSVVWGDWTSAAHFDENGRPAYFLTSVLDITAQRRHADMLAIRLRLLELAAGHSIEEVLRQTLDESEKVTGSTVGFYHFLGADQRTLSLQAWSTRTLRQFCTAEGAGSHYDIDKAGVWVDCVRERRTVVHNDYSSLPHRKGMPPGHAPVIRELVTPVIRDNKIVAILGIGNKPADYTEDDVRTVEFLADVTWTIAEQKRAEEKRRTLEATLAQTDRLTSMGMLAAGVAHEINNPLAYVLYNIESLSQDLPRLAEGMRRCHAALSARIGDGAMAEILGNGQHVFHPAMFDETLTQLREALSGTLRIRSITRSLGTFARVEQVEMAPVDLEACIEHALAMAANELKFRARLVRDYTRVPAVLASEGKLAQVFLNLLINAAHAIDEGHVEDNEVRVRTWSEAGSVYAAVSDTGKGIAPEHRDQVFEPFFTTKGVGVGSGLGLSICEHIVTEFGGEISFTCDVGRGTKFVIRLPQLPSGWERAGSETPERAGAPRPTRGRILVIDDEDGVRAILARILQHDHDVITASSGTEARALLETDKRFDVIFCDLMMPSMSGMELHAWLAEQDPHLADRVVFVTGGAFTPGATAYLAKVGNQRIEKPFDATSLKKMSDALVLAARAKTRP
jgi:PAS domain S-box-containing protein